MQVPLHAPPPASGPAPDSEGCAGDGAAGRRHASRGAAGAKQSRQAQRRSSLGARAHPLRVAAAPRARQRPHREHRRERGRAQQQQAHAVRERAQRARGARRRRRRRRLARHQGRPARPARRGRSSGARPARRLFSTPARLPCSQQQARRHSAQAARCRCHRRLGCRHGRCTRSYRTALETPAIDVPPLTEGKLTHPWLPPSRATRRVAAKARPGTGRRTSSLRASLRAGLAPAPTEPASPRQRPAGRGSGRPKGRCSQGGFHACALHQDRRCAGAHAAARTEDKRSSELSALLSLPAGTCCACGGVLSEPRGSGCPAGAACRPRTAGTHPAAQRPAVGRMQAEQHPARGRGRLQTPSPAQASPVTLAFADAPREHSGDSPPC